MDREFDVIVIGERGEMTRSARVERAVPEAVAVGGAERLPQLRLRLCLGRLELGNPVDVRVAAVVFEGEPRAVRAQGHRRVEDLVGVEVVLVGPFSDSLHELPAVVHRALSLLALELRALEQRQPLGDPSRVARDRPDVLHGRVDRDRFVHFGHVLLLCLGILVGASTGASGRRFIGRPAADPAPAAAILGLRQSRAWASLGSQTGSTRTPPQNASRPLISAAA